MTLSIVTTLYRSAPHLEEFYRRASAAAETITSDYEIVFVNDGSPDDSLLIALDLFERDPRVRVVDLARNFGHHKAMMTGLAPCPRPARLPDRLGPRGGSRAADGVCRHPRHCGAPTSFTACSRSAAAIGSSAGAAGSSSGSST